MATITMDKLIPRKDWALILVEPRKRVTASGLHLPDSEVTAEKLGHGPAKIVRLGPGDKASDLGVNVGDRVLFRTYLKHVNPLPHNEKWEDGSKKEYVLVDLDDLLATLEGDADVSIM